VADTRIVFVIGKAQTPLHLACAFAPNLVPILVKAGASLDVKEMANQGFTPLHFAALFENADCVKFLIESYVVQYA
jgi:ankyrin repeat protein